MQASDTAYPAPQEQLQPWRTPTLVSRAWKNARFTQPRVRRECPIWLSPYAEGLSAPGLFRDIGPNSDLIINHLAEIEAEVVDPETLTRYDVSCSRKTHMV